MNDIVLSDEQLHCQQAVTEWFAEAREDFTSRPIFRVFGYAGTGKTTIIKSTLAQLDVHYGAAAFTGKAALVMGKQGLPARTIHSLIYRLVDPAEDKIKELEEKLKTAPEAERKAIRAELRQAMQPQFELNEESNLHKVKVLVLDECSMVNDSMLNDLKWFEVPLLVLGDPGQLPPIDGTGALVRDDPDVMLTQIHRQAADNPIIDFATRARNNIPIPYVGENESKAAHISKRTLTPKRVLSADQILCGKNATRRALNSRIRALLGRKDHLPIPGDKLICLRNNTGLGLFNGMFCEVTEVLDLLEDSIELMIQKETGGEPIKVEALRAYFDAYHDKGALENVPWYVRTRCDDFDYGYAITVHKSQGSQWDDVILFDDGFLSWKRKDRARWLYTAITRAAETFTLAD